VKTLGYNTTNGHVVYSGTNTLTFTNNVVFDRVQAASAGSLTNLSFQIGAPDLGFYNSQGPDKINAVVGGATRATITSSGISASLFSGGLSVNAGQSISFNTGADIAISRTNLGLGWSALTNTNAQDFYTNTLTAYSYISAAILEGLSQVRADIGLGSGITTNITFVDADTNTNSVTISNGIITGWTQ
jgi:hypothetical protein